MPVLNLGDLILWVSVSWHSCYNTYKESYNLRQVSRATLSFAKRVKTFARLPRRPCFILFPVFQFDLILILVLLTFHFYF